MKLNLTANETAKLKAFLKNCSDAEALTENEYVLDLYDIEEPVSMDLVFKKDKVFADGAAYLNFDEEMDGWYITVSIEDPSVIREALISAGALE